MIDVFISYKVMNRKTAIEYYKSLKEQKINAWFDQLIPRKEKWDKHLKQKMIDSKLVLCLISESTIKDKWVLNQIYYARKYHKRIIFINLDNTPIELFKKYKIKEPVYNSLEEVNICKYFTSEYIYEDYLYLSDIVYKKQNKPFLMTGIISLLTLITFFYGLNLFNLHTNNQISFMLLGVMVCYLLTFISSKRMYLFSGVISVVLLTISMYVIEPYYITDISVIPLVFMLVFFFMYLVRYSSMKYFIINFITSLIYATFLVTFTGAVNVFFIYLFNLDVSLFNYLMLIEFLISTYFNSKSHFIINKEYKYVNDIISGKNIIKLVEEKYES